MAGFEVPLGHNDLALRWNPMGPLRGRHSRFRDFCRFGWILTRLTFLAARVWNLAPKPRHWYRWLQSSVPTCRNWNFEKTLIFAGFGPPFTPGPTCGRGLHEFKESWWFMAFISNFSKFVVQTSQNKHLLPYDFFRGNNFKGFKWTERGVPDKLETWNLEHKKLFARRFSRASQMQTFKSGQVG